MAPGCLDQAVKYAGERSQFGRPIGGFQLVQGSIARFYADIEPRRWQLFYYRDAVLSTILGGTSEMRQLMIGRELTGINAMV
jgi:alkylation response protein AidB-like acyl-CoA dehydrogenase